jgi:hypothetical protein
MVTVSVIMVGMQNGFGRYKLSWLGREVLKFAPNKSA